MLQFYKKNCMLMLNNQIVRYTGKNSFQKCRCISTRCQFYRAWVKRAQWTELWNAKQNNMNFIIWLYQNFMNVWVIKSLKKIKKYCFSSRGSLYCAGHNFLRKNVSLLLTKSPPFCTVHTNINKSFNSFYIRCLLYWDGHNFLRKNNIWLYSP